MQNNKMPKIAKFLIFIVSCMVILGDVAFIAWGSEFDLLIVVPAALAAAYLAYAVACWAILKPP
jgi:hypothetical protein